MFNAIKNKKRLRNWKKIKICDQKRYRLSLENQYHSAAAECLHENSRENNVEYTYVTALAVTCNTHVSGSIPSGITQDLEACDSTESENSQCR